MSDLSRRQFISRTSSAAIPLILLPGIAKQWTGSSVDFQIVDTKYGKLRGYRENGVNFFKGVPYAGEISGVNRFKKAGRVEPWTGVRDAIKLGNPSIQPANQTYGLNEPEPDENCLVLNIWTPANDGKKRPVMVYNHGGGFRTGSGGAVSQDGANLARMYDVVVVATNHRLGFLGFLYLEELADEEYRGSGNRGVQDIAIALKWINENITEFGGDPNNVMIFGESGGGMKTSCLYAMPEAAPYFNKASIESGPGVEIMSPETAAASTREVLKYLNISPKNWKKILEVPAAKILEAQENIPVNSNGLSGGFHGIGNSGIGGYGAVQDGAVMPANPFDPNAPVLSREKPLLVGWNEEEYIFFAMVGGDTDVFTLSENGLKLRLQKDFGENAELIQKTYCEAYPEKTSGEIYIAVRSILMMGLGSIRIAERKARQKGAPIYLYNFGYKSNAKIPGTEFEMGAMHAMDIPFKFYNVEGGMAGNAEDRFQASKNMTSFWTNFAKKGVPSAPRQPDWPEYNLEKRSLMRIDTQCSVLENRFGKVREMWEDILL